MKEKWKEMSGGRRTILIVLAVMAIGFTVAYMTMGLRMGIQYRGSFLSRTERDGNTVYAGTVQMKDTSFTVTPQGQVTLQIEGNTFGPFKVTEDSASPSDREGAHKVTLAKGDELIFQGELRKISGNYWLVKEDGGIWAGESPIYVQGDSSYGAEGWDDLPYRLMVSLVADPPVISRADWEFYWLGMLVTALAAASVIWEDKLFRFQMSFRVRDTEKVEPSDWEMMSRWLGWGAMIVAALLVFSVGFSQ